MRYVVKLGPDLYWTGRASRWTGNYACLADATRFRTLRTANARMWKFRDENPDHFAVVEFFLDTEFANLIAPDLMTEAEEFDDDDE